MPQFRQLRGAGYSGDGNGQYWRYKHLLAAYQCVQAGNLIIFLPVLQMAFPVCLPIDLAPHQESKSSRLDCPLQKLIVSPHCEAEGSYLAPCDHEAVSVDPVSSSSERTSPFLPLSHNVTSPTASDTISHYVSMIEGWSAASPSLSRRGKAAPTGTSQGLEQVFYCRVW